MDLYTSPKNWGPHFWYMMRCIAHNYPINPTINDARHTKIFYYEIQYILPCDICRYTFSQHLNKFPIDNNLDSREKLIEWVEHIYEMTKKDISENRVRVINNYDSDSDPKPLKVNNSIKNIRNVPVKNSNTASNIRLNPELKTTTPRRVASPREAHVKKKQINLNKKICKFKPKIDIGPILNHQSKPYLPYYNYNNNSKGKTLTKIGGPNTIPKNLGSNKLTVKKCNKCNYSNKN